MALTFVLGLLVAGAATAGAATLITGKQIKDGSITKRDLAKALQKQLAKSGAVGATGLTGPAGAPGTAGAKGADGAAGPSNAYASHLDGADSATGTADVTSVSVPAGNYTVTAKLYAVRPAVGPTTDLLCSLLAGAKTLDYTNSGFNTNVAEPYFQLPLAGFVKLDAPGTIRLSCLGNGQVFSMYSITLIAQKVGALDDQTPA